MNSKTYFWIGVMLCTWLMCSLDAQAQRKGKKEQPAEETGLTLDGKKKKEDWRDKVVDENGNKQKIKKCPENSCQVRLVHYHEGAPYYGKRTWFLKRWFYFNRNPKIGEGFKRKMKRDPHQSKKIK